MLKDYIFFKKTCVSLLGHVVIERSQNRYIYVLACFSHLFAMLFQPAMISLFIKSCGLIPIRQELKLLCLGFFGHCFQKKALFFTLNGEGEGELWCYTMRIGSSFVLAFTLAAKCSRIHKLRKINDYQHIQAYNRM